MAKVDFSGVITNSTKYGFNVNKLAIVSVVAFAALAFFGAGGLCVGLYMGTYQQQAPTASATRSAPPAPLCSAPTTTPSADHPRPTWMSTPFQFRVSTIEDGKPVDYALYFDFVGDKQGHKTKYKDGKPEQQHIYQFVPGLGKSILISRHSDGQTCLVSDLFKPDGNKYRASLSFLPESLKFPAVEESEIHTIGVDYIFLFGDGIPSEYVDSVTIRGLQTDHWRWCNDQGSSPIEVGYYFLPKASHDSAYQVLWQIVVTERGITGLDTSSTYDITNFMPVDTLSPALFELPRGLICDGIAQKDMPTIDYSFALVTEMIFPAVNTIFMIKEYHDYEHKLSRYDFTPNPTHTEGDDSYAEMFGHDRLGVIHQFLGDSGLEYVLMPNGSCHVRVLNPDLNVGNWNDMRATNSNDSIQTAMRHGNGFFDLDHLHTTYQGKKQFRNMEADTWAFATDTTHVEVYFTPEQWVSTSHMSSRHEANTKQLLAGIWMKSDIGESFSHTVDYLETTYIGTIDHIPFDITQCYQKGTRPPFRLQIEGDQGVFRHVTHKEVREQMAQVAGVSIIRLQIDSIYLMENKIDIWVTLFEKPLLSTPVASGGVDPTDYMISKELAFRNIENKLKHDGINFTFFDFDLEEEVILHAIIKPEPEPHGNTATNGTKKRFTNGSMATLCIIMLLLGCFLGL